MKIKIMSLSLAVCLTPAVSCPMPHATGSSIIFLFVIFLGTSTFLCEFASYMVSWVLHLLYNIKKNNNAKQDPLLFLHLDNKFKVGNWCMLPIYFLLDYIVNSLLDYCLSIMYSRVLIHAAVDAAALVLVAVMLRCSVSFIRSFISYHQFNDWHVLYDPQSYLHTYYMSFDLMLRWEGQRSDGNVRADWVFIFSAICADG